jgi:hypothetical protein
MFRRRAPGVPVCRQSGLSGDLACSIRAADARSGLRVIDGGAVLNDSVKRLHRFQGEHTEVREPWQRPSAAPEAKIRSSTTYTVEQCLKDWLETLNTQAESTVTGCRIMVRHLVELLGSVKLVELKVRDVDFALGKLAKRLSTRSVRLARMILIPRAEERPTEATTES